MKPRAARRAPAAPGLLDVNVLIALIDSAHRFHSSAHHWFRLNRRHGWATCPITENGCIRILSSPGYPFPGLTSDRVRDILSELTRLDGHLFWPDSVSMLHPGLIELAGAGPKHLTDLYLLALAVHNRGRLVTFDRAIRRQSVARCTQQHLEVLPGEPPAA